MQLVLERGSIDYPLTFAVSYRSVHLIHATFQSNCAEGLHFSALYFCLVVTDLTLFHTNYNYRLDIYCPLINLRRACAARVTVVVLCVCVGVCVCVCVCVWVCVCMYVRRILPPHACRFQNIGSNGFNAMQKNFYT